ncbi:ubiquitin-like small modifier protein 1 [Geoglobus acetivorans]|uniref:Molybdopterin biosynthesis protein n=1 Tax=Geoglobus acetivorans TaxID=565033 RepID=A0A0A7GDP4_GEOAI|nr:molybdopterin biosynthesis protein [Geoglobus acetivorans]
MIKVKFPTVFVQITGKRRIEVDGVTTVSQLLEKLFDEYPQLKERLIKDGDLSPFINIFVNGEDIRFLNGLDTEIKDGDEVAFIPAISGG